MPEYRPKRWKRITLFCLACSCCATLLFAQIPAASSTLELQRKSFKKAWQSVISMNWDAARREAKTLTDYPLLPYLRAEQMRLRPDAFSSTEVSEYIDTYADWGFAPGLRVAWLRQLGESGRYSHLLEIAAANGSVANSTDTEVRCYLARARIAEADTSADQSHLIKAVTDLWLVGKSQHKSCDPAFDWLRRQGGITSEVAWERIHLAMEQGNIGLARYLRRFLTAEHSTWLNRWLSMSAAKNRTLLAAQKWPDQPFAWQITRWGLEKLARSDAEQAWQRFQTLDTVFNWSDDYRHPAMHAIGVFSSLDLKLPSLAIIDHLPTVAQDQQILEWRTRVALANNQWREVIDSIERMSLDMQADNRWLYWRARALLALGLNVQAQSIWQQLAQQPTYYGFMAADLLGQPYTICSANLPDVYAINDLPRPDQAGRALELYQVGRLSEAAREWRMATADLSTGQNLIAARLAADAGWLIQSIFTLTGEQARQYYSLRFPTAYENLIRNEARLRRLDPALMYGLIRAESAMNPRAISSANARGLMQVTPGTARRLAGRYGRVYRGSGSLLQPEINVPFGSLMLQETLSRFNQNFVDVLGAYNAGPHVVERWHQQQRPDIADIWIETLPYFETRDYIPRVLAFSVIYDWQLNGRVTPITQRMPGLFKGNSPFKPLTDSKREIKCGVSANEGASTNAS